MPARLAGLRPRRAIRASCSLPSSMAFDAEAEEVRETISRYAHRKETGMKQAGAALAMLLLLGALLADAQDAPGPSLSSGVFTVAQAKRGDAAYQASCSGCHGTDLRATDAEAVDLTGPAFRARW